MQLKQTVPTQDRLWQNNRRGRGRRGGRGRGRGSNIHDSQTPRSEDASPSRSSGRGRGKGRGRSKGHAHAVTKTPPATDDGMSYAGNDDEDSSDEVKDITSYIDFTIDSACYPSYLRLNRDPMATDITGHATVADGRRVPVADVMNVRVATENGFQFNLHRVCRANFAKSLLSRL